MATLNEFLTSIADAIREKKGTTEPINAQNFASEISSIEGGGSGGITLNGIEEVTTLPSATEEEYERHKIYLHESNLKYLAKELSSEGYIKNLNPLSSNSTLMYTAAYNNRIYYCSSGDTNLYVYDIATNTSTKLMTYEQVFNHSAMTYLCAMTIVSNKLYIYAYLENSSYSTKMGYRVFDILDDGNLSPAINTTSASKNILLLYTNIISKENKIYLIGGVNATNGTTSAAKDYIYNISFNESTGVFGSPVQVGTLPTTLERHCSVLVENCIYIFGGRDHNSTTYDTIHKFDTSTNTLTTLNTKLPTPMRNMGAAAIGNDIYLFGGSNASGTNLNTIYKFDTLTETITLLDITLPTLTWGSSAITINDTIYILGGNDGVSALNRMLELTFGEVLVYKTFKTE